MAADEETERVYADIAKLAALREQVADLAGSVLKRMESEEVDRAMEIRAALLTVVDGQRIFEGVLSMCEVMYLILEQVENESIVGFIKAKSEGSEI